MNYTYTSLKIDMDQTNHEIGINNSTMEFYVHLPKFNRLNFQINDTQSIKIQYVTIDFCLNQNTYDVKQTTDIVCILNRST